MRARLGLLDAQLVQQPDDVVVGERRKPQPRGELMRARLGLLDAQLVQQPDDVVVDELAAVVGMKSADHERELFQDRLQHR